MMSPDKSPSGDDPIDLGITKVGSLPGAREIDVGEVLEADSSDYMQKKVLRKLDLW